MMRNPVLYSCIAGLDVFVARLPTTPQWLDALLYGCAVVTGLSAILQAMQED